MENIILQKEYYQPLGNHNKKAELVKTSSIENLIKFPFTHFNPPQSESLEHFNKDCNIVVSAPTASGKTVIIELWIIKTLLKNGKSLYLSPMKALTEEKYEDWTNPNHTFSKYKISIITGDFILSKEKLEELNDADIIVATAEMLDSKTRNFGKYQWLQDIKLVVS